MATTNASVLADKRVLVAEDSHAQQRFLAFWLEKAGATVTLVEDGGEAVEHADREPFDAILLDMQMPKVDGYEAAAQLRRQGYRGPLVALTAANREGDEQRCIQAGCDCYLGKPIEPAALLDLLSRLLAVVAPPVLAEDKSFQKLVQVYVGGLSEQVRQLRAALAAEDRTDLAKLAHKMRGGAATYGFAALAETAGLLEDAVREGQDRELLAELLGEMEEEVRRLETQ